MSGDPVALVDLIAAAVLACPLVAAIFEGQSGDTTTLLPGNPIGGVTVSSTAVVIRVVGRYPAKVSDIVDQVRTAVVSVGVGKPVVVKVEDLVLPGLPAVRTRTDDGDGSHVGLA